MLFRSGQHALLGLGMSNSYDLGGKFAVVTGAARGIGRAIVTHLLASRARVCIWDMHPMPIDGVTSEVVDVTRPDEISGALARISTGNRIDILVNNAGYLGQTQNFEEHSPADWLQIVSVNLLGTMRVTQAVLPFMRRAGGGRIINLGSLAGKEGLPGLAAYSAASAGVIGFTKALSREVIGDNIFVNCIAPGPIDTDMIRGLGANTVNAMISDSPMRRLGLADEVAHLTAWLCSDASRFNPGAVFDMSGGRARY